MRLGHLLAVTLAALTLVPGVSSGFVGIQDRCSLPTPYPPEGAGAGTANNSDFERSFTNGTAEGWTAFKSSGYTGQVHFEGFDRPYRGDKSQKLVLPEPSTRNQSVGVYQQIWVVPGEIYTASVRVYLEPPAQQTYNGEDLVAWLGLDPYGEPGGEGKGMVWSAGGVQGYRWLTLVTSARAVLPVMTVSLKGTRNWAQHGNDARVWFDDLVISGPVPTGNPPGPEPDPVDPEMLIPRTFGANLVVNGGFEQPFAGGVSAGWNKWSTVGYGAWRQSRRVGKIGGGRYDCGNRDALADMNPKVILLYGGTPSASDPNDAGEDGVYGDVEYLTEKYPHLENTIFIGRPDIASNWEIYKTAPRYYGRQLADQLWTKQQKFPRIDCWQGLNQPDTGQDWPAALAFELAFAERAHELGMKVCSLNLASGEPASIWRMVDETFSPSCRELLAVTDYLGYHCYGGPNDDLMVINQSRDDTCEFSMRPRRFRDLYERRGWRFPPVLATEGSTAQGWHGNWRPETIAVDLVTMGKYMNENRWWCGFANFVAGGSCGWPAYEILGQGNIVKDVGTFNANNPADATEGLYSQMFGAGQVHPRTLEELAPAGRFTGGINRQVGGLTPGQGYLVACWMKYEFRGQQPTGLRFHIGVDPTGQTANGNAPSIDWGADQIADKGIVHEVFTHVWRTFTAVSPTVSIWLRASQSVADPSFMVYVDNVEVRQLNSGRLLPVVELAPRKIELATHAGVNLPSGSFTVRNASKAGTLMYEVESNADWLLVNPMQGKSTGGVDTINLVYDVAKLVPGTHEAVVTVSAPGAANSPQTLQINLTVSTVRADFDQDGDVDDADLDYLQSCMDSMDWPPSEECAAADLNDDEEVDSVDLDLFQRCVSGTGVPADPDCLRP